tara:strand:- start:133 stop:444 length:312 start_codon:yes stop_codon:yes gene_type:complete
MDFNPNFSFMDKCDKWKPTVNFVGLLYTLVAFDKNKHFTTRNVILSEEITDIDVFIEKNREYLNKSNLTLAWVHIFRENDTGISKESWTQIKNSPYFLIDNEC